MTPPGTMGCLTSSNRRHLITIGDLGKEEIRAILALAEEFSAPGRRTDRGRPFSVGLLFFAPSLRTRVGFAEATFRLGGSVIDVSESRFGPGMSHAESYADTIRTFSGMVDAVVTRTPFALDRQAVERNCMAPLINGGDGNANHPTQSLVDMFAIEHLRGPIRGLSLGICGDLRSRCSRSLLALLEMFPPRDLTLISPVERSLRAGTLGPILAARTSTRPYADPRGLDVLYLVGLPEGEGHERLGADQRAPFVLTPERLRDLPTDSIILSPLPVIDEITDEARLDPRVRFFQQSDLGVWVRMAVLELLRGSMKTGWTG